MSKTVSGFVLVGGIATAIVFAIVAAVGATGSKSPATDFMYDCIKFGGFAGVLVGAGMFFYGAMHFSRK